MMKREIIIILILIVFGTVNAQNYYMETPEGFGEGATGGGDAAPTIVTTYNDLKSKIASSSAAVILVSGEITIPDGGIISAIVKNKTILGLPGARLISTSQTQSGSGTLYLQDGSENVIIRNLIFEGPGAYDTDGRDNLCSDGCIKLWVDHCEFQDGTDGNFDLKGNTDNVTISWCKFTYLKPPTPGGPGGSDDHRFSDLVGSSSSAAPSDGHYSITFQNCYWADGCRERMPRARNAELHILNCYYNTTVSSSLAFGIGGGINNSTCYVEKTNFARISNVYKEYTSDGGSVDINFVDCLKGTSDHGTVNKPTYTYTALPVEDVEMYLTNESCGAGATLLVNEDGQISTICDGTLIYDLTAETIGTGVGTIELSPEGGSYEIGTIVTLTARSGENSYFIGWGGDIDETKWQTTVTVEDDINITANFEMLESQPKLFTESVKCYPLYVSKTFYIEFPNSLSGEAFIKVYSLTGAKVMTLSQEIVSNKVYLDVSNLTRGIYFCSISANNMETVQKFVKK